MSRKKKPEQTKVEYWRNRFKSILSFEQLLFLPGFFLIFSGILLLVAPRLILATLVLFLISCGIISCLLARRLISFKRRIVPMLKGIEGQILIHRPQLGDLPPNSEEKKVVIH